jgi:hypothetical protein
MELDDFAGVLLLEIMLPEESGDCHHPRLDRDCFPEVGKRRHLATQPDVLSLRRAM